MLWRQGDIFIETARRVPDGAAQQPHLTLADGELTGHSHRVANPDTALLFEHDGELFLQVIADRAEIIHEEHGTIELLRGDYRVWRQREYDPMAARLPAGITEGAAVRRIASQPSQQWSRWVTD